MKQILKYIVFGLVVFSLIFGGTGTLRVGPFSWRHICTSLLIFYLLNNVTKVKVNSVFKFYLVYLFVYIVANIVNGEIDSHHFAQSLYTYHLPSLTVILVFPLLVKSYQDLGTMTKVIVGLYLFNAVITILQFAGVPLAWEIGRSIADLSVSKADNLDAVSANSDSLFGYAMASGIIGFAVTNGYIMASYLPLLSRDLYRNYNYRWILSVGFMIVALIAVFSIQQRTALFLVMLYLLFFAIFRSNTALKISSSLLILLWIGTGQMAFDYDLGRINDVSSGFDTRNELWNNFKMFLDSPYMFFGGFNNYTQKFGMVQHNTFLSSWVLGGVLAFLCFCSFYLYLMKNLAFGIKKVSKVPQQYADTIVYASSAFIYLLYSLTHSDGVQNGSPMFWILYSLFLISQRFESMNYKANIQAHNGVYARK